MLTNNDGIRSTLIIGETEICKALLFESAISWAKEGQYVYYFAPKRLESLPLSFHDRSEPSADAFKLITFIYTPTYDVLASQLIRLHTFQRPASIILIDDLDSFSGVESNVLQAARCCALILDTARRCSNDAKKCPVQVCATSFCRELHNVYKMYFDKHWIVNSEPGQNNTDETRTVWIRDVESKRALEYCRLDDAVLVLKTVYANEEVGESTK